MYGNHENRNKHMESTKVWITQKQEKKEETLTRKKEKKNEKISGRKAHTSTRKLK